MWDDEVDVVCCGSGFGTLAAAIAAAEAGLDVHIARPGDPSRRPSELSGAEAPWLGAGVTDPETRAYLDALSADLDPTADTDYDNEPAVRPVSEWTPVTGRGRIAPFYGARLGEWARSCLVSPYGVLYTRLTDRGMTPMQTRAGEEIQVKLLGAVEIDGADRPAAILENWLSAQVRERQILASDDSALQRLVFEEGEIVGVVIDTADGPLALRTRHGVAVSSEPRGATSRPSAGGLSEPGKPLQVGLVGYNASRFGRVELLAPERDAARSDYCSSGRVHDARRESGRSHARRGREVHRYPPFGQ